MRILLWAPFGAGTHYWGPGTSAFRLYKNLKDKNVKVTLVHASDFQGDFPDVYHEQVQLGSIDNKSKMAFIKYLISSYLWIKKNHHKYDAFHGITAYFHTFLPALFFNKYNKNSFLKLSGEYGGFGSNSRLSTFLGMKRLRLKRANTLRGYISISSNITSNLLNSGIKKDKIFYIPNGVDTEKFSPVSDIEKSNKKIEAGFEDIFTICYIGGLTENKNVMETVKAVHHLVDKGFDLQFLIVGPDRSGGKEENKINRYISEHNLEEVCIRINHTDNPESYYSFSDIFVLNSKFEGLSNSLLEAMSSGLPCVAYPASGTVDLVEDGYNGFLTNGTAKQIIEKVKTIMEDDKLYKEMSDRCRKIIEKEFAVDIVLSKHIELFKGY